MIDLFGTDNAHGKFTTDPVGDTSGSGGGAPE